MVLSQWANVGIQASDDLGANRLLLTVEECFDDAIQRTKTVVKHMPEYTLHDEVHLVEVVRLMGCIIPERTLSKLSALELAALILSAAYHDIGMAPSDAEVRALLSSDADPTTEEKQQYLALREAYPGLLKRQTSLRHAERHFEAQEIEAGLLVEYLRRTHTARQQDAL